MDKIKAAEDYATVQIGDPAKFTNSDQHSKHECCQEDFIAGWDAALSTHPLQQKIDGLREALIIIESGDAAFPDKIAKQALETYK